MSDAKKTMVLTTFGRSQSGGARHFLSVVEGALTGRLLELVPAPTVLGRSADCDLQLDDAGVSGRHCRVALLAGQVVVEDLGSTNGVYVDDERVDGLANLPVGAVLSVGRCRMRHVIRDPADVRHQVWLDEELRKASDYARSLLPEPLAADDMRIAWRFEPSAHLGGDAFGYHRLDDGRLAIYLLDVCGHGPGAALHSVSVVNVLRGRTLGGVDFGRPGDVLAALNETFRMEAHGGMYFTIWYGVFDGATGVLDHASAGHPAPLLLRAGGGLEPLSSRGLAAGMMPGMAYADERTELRSGDRLYIFSDGVYEVRAKDGRDWSRDELCQLIRAAPGTVTDEPDRIAEAVRDLTGGAPFEDDFSLVVAEVGQPLTRSSCGLDDPEGVSAA